MTLSKSSYQTKPTSTSAATNSAVLWREGEEGSKWEKQNGGEKR